METVEISTEVLLEAMLRQLALPAPVYTNTAGSFFDVTVKFYPSLQHLQSALPPHSIRSYPADTMKEAVDAVSRSAISYMKNHQNKELKDYSYVELEYEKRRTERLRNYIGYKTQKMATQTSKFKDTARACNLYIRDVTACTQRINKILADGQASSSVYPKGKPGVSLTDLKYVATNLTHATEEAVGVLKALRVLPVFPEGYSDDDQSSGYCSNQSEKDYWKCEALDYDFDGRHIDDEY